MNFDLKFHFEVAGLEEKMYVRSEVELLHSMQHLFFMLLLC